MTTTSRHTFLKRFGLALAGFALTFPMVGKSAPSTFQPLENSTARPPNILILLADDQGWGDLSCHGNKNLATPQIDSLARDGAIFERFYVCPVCSPTRAEFLTGRYHPRGGVSGVSTGQERLNLDEQTLAQFFKAAGYATGAFGKWHNGTQWPYHPNARGFDEYYGFCSGHWGTYFDPPLEHNGKAVQGRGYIIDDLTDHALAFIEQNKSKPFLCYVPFNVPHSPMQVPDKYWAQYADRELALRGTKAAAEDIQHTRAALAMCACMDANIGRILQRLDELGLRENTIVIYFSDNGPNGNRWNGGMKGIKGSTDEGGVRVPFLIRWPGHIPSGARVPQIAGAIDLLPTLADLAGVPVQSRKPLDGVSLKPLLLRGLDADWADRMIFSHWAGKVSVRTQRHRLDTDGKLFDMQSDPGQTHDVAIAQPEVAARLRAAVAQWRKDVLAGLKETDRPFTVGYPDFPLTTLPARDGVAHGGIERSAHAPNCSYFTNWKSTAGSITWDVDVERPGRYTAEVFYTCAAADVGATVELSLGESRVTAQVTEAFDPPLRGAENDRVPRKGESLVKDFKPLRFGPLELKQGRGVLKLSALTKPGAQVMDVRQIVLTLEEKK